MSIQRRNPKRPEQATDEKAKHEAFLQKDYELKISYLTNHFARMWTRFNYFVAIETGLVGGKFLIPNGALSKELAIAGALISAVWYVMGAEDRYLVRLYRHQVDQAAEELTRTIWSDEAAQKAYRHVGQVDKDARADLRAAESGSPLARFFRFEWLSGWRWEPVSTTRLAALFPLLIFALWMVILFDTLYRSPAP